MYAMALILAMGLGGAVGYHPNVTLITTVWPGPALLRRYTVPHPQHLLTIIIGTKK
jgi:hypothetical protein